MRKLLKIIDDHFDQILAALIATVAISGALVGWRATRINVGNSDRGVVLAVSNSETTRLINNAVLLRHYRAYADYARDMAIVRLIDEALVEADPTEQETLVTQKEESVALAAINRTFFPPRFLNRDGSYDSERELEERWAEAAQQLSLDPEPYIMKGIQLRNKTRYLRSLVLVQTFALLFLNIAKVLHPDRKRTRYFTAFIGTAGLIFVLAALMYIETAL